MHWVPPTLTAVHVLWLIIGGLVQRPLHDRIAAKFPEGSYLRTGLMFVLTAYPGILLYTTTMVWVAAEMNAETDGDDPVLSPRRQAVLWAGSLGPTLLGLLTLVAVLVFGGVERRAPPRRAAN